MMLNSLRGLLLAASAAILPVNALADCPPESSIDRYAETARDALSALDGLVPESQQRVLEDRYSAMLVLKWEWQGRDAFAANTQAKADLANCILSARCEASTSDLIDANAAIISSAPSVRLLAWAHTALECEMSAELASAVEALDAENEPEETPEPTEIDDAPEAATELVETPPDSAELEIVETEAPELEEDTSIDVAVSDEPIEPDDAPSLADRTSDVTQKIAELTSPELLAASTAAVSDTEADNNPDQLVQMAATFFASGRPAAAIPPLRSACFIEAETLPNSAACETLFDVYNAPTERNNGAANTPNYLALSEELCATGYVRGCQNLAQHYAGQNTADAHVSTVAYTERACELGDGEACATVSGYYLTGRATAPDPKLARDRLEQSCELGRLHSCQEVADYYLRGVGGEPDIEKALSVNEASCPAAKAERADMCVAAADFVFIHMKSGPERSALVRTFTERACALGHDIGCAWYAEDLELGLGGEIDLAAAEEARLTACEFGHQESCDSRS